MVPAGSSEQEIIQPDRVHLNQLNPYNCLFIVLLFKVGKPASKDGSGSSGRCKS